MDAGWDILKRAQEWASCTLPNHVAVPIAKALARGQSRGENLSRIPGRVYETLLTSKMRSGQGAFYTPDEVVAYVVEHTLTHVKSGRILDPACGGGVFVLEALDRLASQRPNGHRPSVRRAIVERRLAAMDIDPKAVAVTKLALALAVGGPVDTSHIVHSDALSESAPCGTFGAVIGNPPWGQKSFRISAADKANFRRRFTCAKGPIDPYGLFIEQAHSWLEPGASWGLVLPEVFLLKGSDHLRRFVLERSTLREILDLGQIFPKVNLGALVVIGALKSVPLRKTKTRVGFSIQPNSKSRLVAQAIWQELPGQCINMHITNPELKLWRRLSKLPKLGDVMEIHEGAHSGNMRSELFVEGPQTTHLQPILVAGKELEAFQISWAGQFLNTRAQKGPGGYFNLGQSHWHESRKVLVRRTGDRIVAACDFEGIAASNNFFLLLPRKVQGDLILQGVSMLLNSDLYTWWYRALNPRAGRLFAEVKIKHLRAMPIPSNFVAGLKKAREFAMLSKRALKVRRAIESCSVNRAVERLFELSPQEQRLIKLRQ